ncbi:hypothetical protein [Cellulomonas fengjieae]|uniref:hypothetical protein n=1 Tax=Cellulomonas fengjieae TaxID=2819978 RepID=UPI001AAE2A8F|nr:hypothetical protein [Cellulomonas fengjieae]MBO3102205.1 hypothetical protein [Cellulomonas fengjieae]
MGQLDQQLAAMPDFGSSETGIQLVSGSGWDALDDAQPDAIDLYTRVRAAYSALNNEPTDEIWSGIVDQARNELQAVVNIIPTIESLARNTTSYSQDALGFRQIFFRAMEWWRQNARPHIHGNLVETAHRVVQIEDLARRAVTAEEEVQLVSGKLREFAAEVGTGQLASHYQAQAQGHKQAARNWGWAVAGFGVAVVVAGFFLFAGSSPSTGADDSKAWLEFAHNSLAKALIVGGLSYGIAFAAKAFRTNTHLGAVYDQKATALRTYPLFAAAVEGDEVRSLVLAELVRSVFSAADTGVLSAGSSDRTIIENSLPLFTQLGPKS